MYNLPRINHEEIEIVNRLIVSKEIDLAIKNQPEQKPLHQRASLAINVNHSKYRRYQSQKRTVQKTIGQYP